MTYTDERLVAIRGPTQPKRKYPQDATEKPCLKCRIVKPLDQFDLLAQGALGRNPRCRDCRREAAKAHTKRNREGLAGQPRPDKCEACDNPPMRRALHYDHDHATGQFRGWLCHGCNAALGNVGDDQKRLLKLIEYLNRTTRMKRLAAKVAADFERNGA